MKKYNVIIATILAIVICMSCQIFAMANDFNNANTVVEDTITKFCENKDLGTTHQINNSLDNDVSIYLTGKADIQQQITELYDTEKQNYSVVINLLNNYRVDNIEYFKYQVITTFNYVISPDIDSGRSEEIDIVYDHNNNKILDFYTLDNYYDEYMRGNDVDLFRATDYSSVASSINLNCKIQELSNNINSNYEIENAEIEDDAPIIMPRLSILNGDKVVSYARNNFKKVNPASGNGTVPYYDFAKISGSYDCTNFVSHALIAGGARVNDPGGTGIKSTGWYYRSLSNRSSSWSGVPNLYNYLTTNTKANTAAGTGRSYTLNGAYWGVSNVIQFHDGSIWRHSCIITQKKKSADGQKSYAYCTGRASATQYNDNDHAADIHAGFSKRVIQVYNN